MGASCKFLHLGPAGTGPGHLRVLKDTKIQSDLILSKSRRLPQPLAVDPAQQLRLPSSRHRCNNIWMQSRNIFQSFSSISVCFQAAAFTIGQSMGVPAPSYNPGAAGAPAAPGRVKTVICKKYDKPEGEDLAFYKVSNFLPKVAHMVRGAHLRTVNMSWALSQNPTRCTKR